MSEFQESSDAGMPELVQALREQTAAINRQAEAVSRLIDYLVQADGLDEDPEPAKPQNYLSGAPR